LALGAAVAFARQGVRFSESVRHTGACDDVAVGMSRSDAASR